MISERTITCPYCGESFSTLVDYSAGSARYFENCQVCCRPIEIHVVADGNGGLLSLETGREDN